MNIKRKASGVAVFGKSGKGKSSYGERYIIGTHHDRIFIYDHQGEFHIRFQVPPVTDFEQLYERVKTERILCFDYSFAYEGALEETFDEFCEHVFNITRHTLMPQGGEGLFVCDELQKVVGPNTAPKPLKNIVQTGRRFHLDWLILSQQPNAIHNSVREQVTELVLYNLVDENSLKFADNMGLDISDVNSLPDLHYNWYNLSTGEARKNCAIVYKQ